MVPSYAIVHIYHKYNADYYCINNPKKIEKLNQENIWKIEIHKRNNKFI